MKNIKITNSFQRQKVSNVYQSKKKELQRQRDYLRRKTDCAIFHSKTKYNQFFEGKNFVTVYHTEQPQTIGMEKTWKKRNQTEIDTRNDGDILRLSFNSFGNKNTSSQYQTIEKNNSKQKIEHRYSVCENFIHEYPIHTTNIDTKQQTLVKDRSNSSPNPLKRQSKSQRKDRKNSKSKLEKMKKFSQSLYIQKFRKYQQLNRAKYKNQKLNILAQEQGKIIRKISDYGIDMKKLQSDVLTLLEIFTPIANPKFMVNRHESQKCKTFFTKLLFFIGYEISLLLNEERNEEEQRYELILTNYYQIYFSMRLKTPLIIMQCYQKLIDIALKINNYVHAQKFAEKCLLTSIYYKEKYYEERCIEKISMCEYYKGNICEATYLHDNNGQVAQQSLKNVRDGYNEEEQLQIVTNHLYNTPRFEVKQILKSYDQRMQNYKMLVAFNNPRIDPQSSMQSKKKQLKHDVRAMERCKDFKSEADIIKRQITRRQDLFCVKRILKPNQHPKLLFKQNPIINVQNESSQVLKAHQSMNRLKKINHNAINNKMKIEFLQFITNTMHKIH